MIVTYNGKPTHIDDVPEEAQKIILGDEFVHSSTLSDLLHNTSGIISQEEENSIFHKFGVYTTPFGMIKQSIRIQLVKELKEMILRVRRDKFVKDFYEIKNIHFNEKVCIICRLFNYTGFFLMSETKREYLKTDIIKPEHYDPIIKALKEESERIESKKFRKIYDEWRNETFENNFELYRKGFRIIREKYGYPYDQDTESIPDSHAKEFMDVVNRDIALLKEKKTDSVAFGSFINKDTISNNLLEFGTIQFNPKSAVESTRKEIAELREKVKNQATDIKHKDTSLRKQSNTISELSAVIKRRNKEIEKLNEDVINLKANVVRHYNTIVKLQKENEELKKQLNYFKTNGYTFLFKDADLTAYYEGDNRVFKIETKEYPSVSVAKKD